MMTALYITNLSDDDKNNLLGFSKSIGGFPDFFLVN